MSIVRTMESQEPPVLVIVQYLMVPSAPPEKQELLGRCKARLVIPVIEESIAKEV